MAKEELFNENIGLAFSIVRRCYQNVYLDILDNDDLKQLALLGLWKASETYDEKQGVLFKTYADKCIKNEINRYVFNHKKTVSTISLNTVLYDNVTIEDTLSDEKDYANGIEAEIFCDNLISKIKSNRNQQIIRLAIMQKEKECDIAKQFNISRQAISSTIRRNLNFLKKEMNK